MGQYRKKGLLRMIGLMEDANKLACSSGRKHQAEIVDLLIQCQKSALEIGNCLESMGGPGQAVVPMVEGYCEYLYEMSQSFEDRVKYKKLGESVRKNLIQIRKKIRYELPQEKKEMVFLPYKASMWDSMESVWEAALKDGEYDVYVVPIPYFDRNPDKSFGEMHYEGDKYPDYVPVTSWETYHVEERYPDAIFIHNPYDQFNFITSVHPSFYSSRIKDYTDMLVYIPYFVATAHQVQGHFCTLPGTFYADRVIVEDEEIRKSYIRHFCEYEEKMRCRGVFGKAEEKFLALGSPKFDKVLTTRREDIKVPLEWEGCLYKKGGGRKKVILYNTTLDAMLKQNSFIGKLRSVLRAFYENREEVALLWRPHPLYMATIQAMKPQDLEEYQKIIAGYKEAGYGIYDDTADLYRAIALSDAYYGDWSSVVSLYEKTGKPILIQNADIL